MKITLISRAAATLLFAGLAVAPAVQATPQQERMKACNIEAKDKKGDERKAFMKQCLSASKSGEAATAASTGASPAAASGASTGTSTAASTLTPQQQKMKGCNAEAKAKGLAGDERKKFMSTCLKG